MRRGAAIGVLIAVNFILQTTLFRYIEILGVKPNTALLLIISFAVLRGDVTGAITGFAAGLLWDLGSGGALGYYALCGLLTGWLCGKPFGRFYRENYLFPSILTLTAALLWEFAYCVTHVMPQGGRFASYFLRAAVPAVAYTMALCIPVFMFVYWLNGKLDGKRKAAYEGTVKRSL